MEGADIFSEVGDISVNDVITGLFDGYEYCYDCEATGKGDDEGTKYENEPLTAYEHLKKLIDNIGHGLVKNIRIYTKADYLNKRIIKSLFDEYLGVVALIYARDILVDLIKDEGTHSNIMHYLDNIKSKVSHDEIKLWESVESMYIKHRDKVTKELKNT